MKNFVEKGFSQRDLAKELECSQATIKYWLKKYELKTNNNRFNLRTSTHKFCPKCKESKDLSEFYISSDKKEVGGYCKACSNAYHTERVKNVKLKMIAYKGSCCEHCDLKLEDSHYCVFEFHHRDPETKDTNFDKIKYQKWSVIEKELDKCSLLCANCHRLEHAKIEGW